MKDYGLICVYAENMMQWFYGVGIFKIPTVGILLPLKPIQ